MFPKKLWQSKTFLYFPPGVLTTSRIAYVINALETSCLWKTPHDKKFFDMGPPLLFLHGPIVYIIIFFYFL